uniref:Transmembrane protein n=1 Tax=Octopus bimaculoides TaxID=37653 RepID=A0A0L8I6I9_OCTBM
METFDVKLNLFVLCYNSLIKKKKLYFQIIIHLESIIHLFFFIFKLQECKIIYYLFHYNFPPKSILNHIKLKQNFKLLFNFTVYYFLDCYNKTI